jgi:hypothetical protein
MMSLAGLRNFLYGCLVLVPFLLGCRPVADSQTGLGAATQPTPHTPEMAAHNFIQACGASDQTAVLSLLAPLTRQAVVSSGSNPCRHLPPAGMDIPEPAIETAGQTAYARYQWQEDGATAQVELVLIQENNTWLIADSRVAYHRPTRTPLPAAPTIAPVVIGATRGTP